MKGHAMQKYVILSLLILGSASVATATDSGKLSAAIEKQDIEKVRRLIKRIGELEPADKKNLQKDAHEMVSDARENVSLLKSKWDLAKFVGGSTLGACGA